MLCYLWHAKHQKRVRDHTFDTQHIGEYRSGRRRHDGDINRFGNLTCGVNASAIIGHNVTCFPSFYNDTHARAEKNHPTRVCIVVDEIQENHGLDKHVGYDLEIYQMGGISVSSSTASEGRTVLQGRSSHSE